MADYQWTVVSAVRQIRHGGPTHRTLSAIDYLTGLIDEPFGTDAVDMDYIAAALLAELVDVRGLAYLGTSVNPLPDDTETVAHVE